MTGPLPSSLLVLVAIILLGSVMLGLIRVWRGPGLADRMLSAQLFGSTGVALLLVLGELQQTPGLRDVALVLALLAIMAMVAFVARAWRAEQSGDDQSGDEQSGDEQHGDNQPGGGG